MTAKKGRDLILKYDSDGLGAYVTVAGLRDTSIAINNESVKITKQH